MEKLEFVDNFAEEKQEPDAICKCENTTRRVRMYMTRKLELLVILLILICAIASSHGLPSGVNRMSRIRTKRIEPGVAQVRHVRHPHRYRRIVSAMVPIRDRQMSSLCSYEVKVDVNEQRIPDKIDRVLCKKDSCKCVEQGDYRCTQLYTQLNVTYITNDLKAGLDFEMINVEYACVCSRGSGSPGVKVLEPVIV